MKNDFYDLLEFILIKSEIIPMTKKEKRMNFYIIIFHTGTNEKNYL